MKNRIKVLLALLMLCGLRMYLILNALKVVRESVLRKRKRLCEAGDIE